MSESPADTIKKLRSAVHDALRKTDTFGWLTTEAPKHLDTRAQESDTRIEQLRDANKEASATSTGAVADDVLESAVKLAGAEADLQRGLAEWLRQLGQSKDATVSGDLSTVDKKAGGDNA